jgi:uncharacterized membrane protein YeaQ/YmgE (transglycosylase-associated protein family)
MILAATIQGVTFNLDLLSWVIVGLLAGTFASWLVRGHGFGCLGNLVLGLVGAVIGGYLASLLNLQGNYHFWGSLLLAFIGAAILLWILQLLTGGFRWSRSDKEEWD